MRKTKKIFSLFLVILAAYGMKVIFSSFKNVPFSSKPNYVASAASTTANAISYNAEDICNAVKTNKTIRCGWFYLFDVCVDV